VASSFFVRPGKKKLTRKSHSRDERLRPHLTHLNSTIHTSYNSYKSRTSRAFSSYSFPAKRCITCCIVSRFFATDLIRLTNPNQHHLFDCARSESSFFTIDFSLDCDLLSFLQDTRSILSSAVLWTLRSIPADSQPGLYLEGHNQISPTLQHQDRQHLRITQPFASPIFESKTHIPETRTRSSRSISGRITFCRHPFVFNHPTH
jgi:hypothetical protein